MTVSGRVAQAEIRQTTARSTVQGAHDAAERGPAPLSADSWIRWRKRMASIQPPHNG
ncbi:hypothetical protein TRIP_B40091 [uncultured Desulfatiglans sp.]|uniref:Uncharacterized protein n=1 Tax=Uncultured Desulfatiglans sp. TaxID=1748965 RepID=A0A653ADM0_UNCDX|nr:hypothetical protein TRIP_B40091 [uncultured Desulfatiglans sp.]